MVQNTSRTRAYNSPRRREQAAATRRHILDTAQTLFSEHGYLKTTMAAIADEAGVALKTVYLAFETKSRLLRGLWQLVLVGEDDDAPVADRTWYREVIDETNAERQLQLNAQNSRHVKERAASVMRVIRDAANSDEDLADLWHNIQTDFRANQGRIAKVIHQRNALRPDLDVARATDILWTVNHPDVWQLLVVECHWSAEAYEHWVFETSSTQLLRTRA